jgi:metal-responsive CopG/Arc/MetJ family transcriptional regulator
MRLNITLPDELAHKLDDKNNKSRFIAQALEEKFEKEEKENLERLMAQGYMQVRVEDEKVSKDWEKADLDGWE